MVLGDANYPAADAARAPEPVRCGGASLFPTLMLVYLGAITIFGKGPTYLGVPPLYWGELTMLAMLGWMYLNGLLRRVPWRIMAPYSLLVAGYMVLGLVLTVGSVPRYGLDALRNAAIWYYAAFYFVGAYIATLPAVADRLWKRLVWIWVLAAGWNVLVRLTGHWPVRMSPVIPWRGVRLLSGSGSENYMHMALGAILLVLGLPVIRRRNWAKPLIVVFLCVIAGLFFMVSGRGVKIAVVGALLLGFVATFGARRQLWPSDRLLIPGFILVIMLGLIAILAGPQGLSRIGNLTRFSRISKAATEGTAHWRLAWWQNITEKVHETDPAFGLGFGKDLSDLNPYLEAQRGREWKVRSPHCFHVSVFSRMGYVGLTLWLALLSIGIARLFWLVRRGHVMGRHYTRERRKELAFWLMMLTATGLNASFGVLMEGPVLGIWFWFALGFATGRSKGPDGLELSPQRTEESPSPSDPDENPAAA